MTPPFATWPLIHLPLSHKGPWGKGKSLDKTGSAEKPVQARPEAFQKPWKDKQEQKNRWGGPQI
jgi:hypothetical protein